MQLLLVRSSPQLFLSSSYATGGPSWPARPVDRASFALGSFQGCHILLRGCCAWPCLWPFSCQVLAQGLAPPLHKVVLTFLLKTWPAWWPAALVALLVASQTFRNKVSVLLAMPVLLSGPLFLSISLEWQ